MARSGPVERTAEPAAAVAPLVASTPGLRRLSLLEQRLRREAVAQGPAAEGARRRVASHAIANYLRRLREMGVAWGAKHVFRSLGQEPGDWLLPKDFASRHGRATPPTRSGRS